MEVNQEKIGKRVANQEKIEAMAAEHYNRASHVKATHMLTAPQAQASDVIHRVQKGATYKETRRATDGRFGD
jgi:hypothetical protein